MDGCGSFGTPGVELILDLPRPRRCTISKFPLKYRQKTRYYLPLLLSTNNESNKQMLSTLRLLLDQRQNSSEKVHIIIKSPGLHVARRDGWNAAWSKEQIIEIKAIRPSRRER